MYIKDILQYAVRIHASDIYLIGGLPLTFRVHGHQQRCTQEGIMTPDMIRAMIRDLYHVSARQPKALEDPQREDDFSFALSGCGRFRANIFTQRGSLSAVIRVFQFGVPNPVEMHIPETVMELSELRSGLVLVTGPAGNGKTTTMACIIDRINQTRDRTIITMEDPIEIIHRHNKSIVIQREISTDTASFSTALRAALRESPDILLLGEMRDAETMEVAMTAAETGQLLFSSLHTSSAADTVDRILDSFSDKQQPQIRAQLARVLKSVICQKLVPAKDGTLVPAFEIMHVTPAIRNLIREGKTYQFNSVINAGSAHGMCSMNHSLYELYRKGTIDADAAITNSEDPAQMRRKLESEG